MSKKIEKIIFYVFVFSVPFQARFVIARWGPSFNEWTTGFIWGTDLLLAVLLIFWLVRSIQEKRPPKLEPTDCVLVGFFAVAVLSVTAARVPEISWFRLLKLAEFIGLYFYIKSNKGIIFQRDMLYAVVFFSGLFQAIAGIAQSWFQSSIGLHILGESVLRVGDQGMAVFEVGTKLFLRAYGTTPHPNVLAVWLFLSLWSFYALFAARDAGKYRWYLLGAYAVVLYAFFLTFSRIPVALWLIGGVAALFVFYFVRARPSLFAKSEGRAVRMILYCTLAIIALFTSFYWPEMRARALMSRGEEAVTQRIFYNGIAADITRDHRWFGVGIGQFVPELMKRFRYYPAHIYQPAHNIYLLVSSELGSPGTLSLIAFIFFSFLKHRRRLLTNWPILLIAGTFVCIGLFDHMFWTLQQGGFVWWGLFAVL